MASVDVLVGRREALTVPFSRLVTDLSGAINRITRNAPAGGVNSSTSTGVSSPLPP